MLKWESPPRLRQGSNGALYAPTLVGARMTGDGHPYLLEPSDGATLRDFLQNLIGLGSFRYSSISRSAIQIAEFDDQRSHGANGCLGFLLSILSKK